MQKSNVYNYDISTQVEALQQIIKQSPALSEILQKSRALNIENYYIGAGCIAQTVWNYITGLPLDYGISDIDFAYFDTNMESTAENAVILKMNDSVSDLSISIDVKNQARVHLWYENHFGYKIEPYNSLEDAINTWPTTATSIGVRLDEDGRFSVYAPYGLNDLFGMIVRANKTQITEKIYNQKVAKWIAKWPDLTIIPW